MLNCPQKKYVNIVGKLVCGLLEAWASSFFVVGLIVCFFVSQFVCSAFVFVSVVRSSPFAEPHFSSSLPWDKSVLLVVNCCFSINCENLFLIKTQYFIIISVLMQNIQRDYTAQVTINAHEIKEFVQTQNICALIC